MANGRNRAWMKKQMARATKKSQRKIRIYSAACRQWTRQQFGSANSHLVHYLDNLIYYILWLVESIVMVSIICYFYFRYGFRL